MALGMEIEFAVIQMFTGDAPEPMTAWAPALMELKAKGVVFTVFPAKPRIVSFLKAYAGFAIHVLRAIGHIDYYAFRSFYFQPLCILVKLFRPRISSLWFHDGIVEEISFVHPDFLHRIFELFANIMEMIGARFVDWEFVVSEQMKLYSKKKKIQGKRGSIVLPCVVETDKFAPNKQGTRMPAGPVTIGFAGSLAAWQKFEEGCRFLSYVGNTYAIRLHVLTAEIDKAASVAEKYNIDATIESVAHDEVPSKMANWHFALIPVEGGIVTEVCSPLKVTEALAVGLPLLIAPRIGDFSDLVVSQGIGVVFDPEDEASWQGALDRFKVLVRHYEEVSIRARAIAVDRYDWGLMVNILRDVMKS